MAHYGQSEVNCFRHVRYSSVRNEYVDDIVVSVVLELSHFGLRFLEPLRNLDPWNSLFTTFLRVLHLLNNHYWIASEKQIE